VKFYELAIGAAFVFLGRRFVKVAMSMAEDERRWGHLFLGETEVASHGPLLPPEIAAQWKPERGPWAAVIDGLAACHRVTSCPSGGHSQPSASPDPD
jgi:hypothetical protein